MHQVISSKLFPDDKIHPSLLQLLTIFGFDLFPNSGLAQVASLLTAHMTRELEHSPTGRPLEKRWNLAEVGDGIIRELVADLGVFESLLLEGKGDESETEMLVVMGDEYSHMLRSLSGFFQQRKSPGKLFLLANACRGFSTPECDMMGQMVNEVNVAFHLLAKMPIQHPTYSVDIAMIYNNSHDAVAVDNMRLSELFEQFDSEQLDITFALQGVRGWRQICTVSQFIKEKGITPKFTVASHNFDTFSSVEVLDELAYLTCELARSTTGVLH